MTVVPETNNIDTKIYALVASYHGMFQSSNKCAGWLSISLLVGIENEKCLVRFIFYSIRAHILLYYTII